MRSPFILTLVIGLLLGASLPALAGDLPPGGTFLDDDGSVHEGNIEAIAGAGITHGCSQEGDRFCPGDPVTRGEMAAFLRRALNLPNGETAGFTDTEGSIFAQDIDALAAAGITKGCGDAGSGLFCPDDPVLRGAMAAFLSRALELPNSDADTFIDDDGSTFERDIEAIKAAGITVGCNPPENTRFCPSQAVTRAEMATFLARALDLEALVVPPRPAVIDLISRETWGAQPPTSGFSEHSISQITIHHTTTPGSTQGPQRYRNIQSYHFSQGWPDIAYHFIIGYDGAVYEARPVTAVGDTATNYDPTGHLLIVVEGDYNKIEFTDVQFEALAEVVAWASVEFDVSLDTLSGHRDHASTTCPGDNLYAVLHDGSLVERAAELIANGGVSLER